MTESTARVELLTPSITNSSYYVWEVPQKPVSVRIAFGVIDRMEKEVIESFRSLTSRGSEIGGLLLGTVKPGSPLVVSVEDYEAIPCDYARGPLYRLSDADMGRFERVIEQRAAAGGALVLGFFRSHTRKGLSLDAEDAAFLEARFREPHQVALLVRPYATKASAAGIFIWEQGTLRAECSYLEFPFRSTQLTAAPPSGGPADPLPAGATMAAAPAPAAPKPTARAQIVPIASRREISLPPAPAAAPAPAERPAETPAQAMAAAAAAAAASVPASPARPPAAPAKTEIKIEEPPAAAQPPAPEEAAPKPEKQPGHPHNPAAIVIIAAALLLAIFLFIYPGVLHRGHAAMPAQDASPLTLRIERTGTDILLTWNRDSEAIRNASHAVLSISDGERHENYDMDLGQLRNGSIVYSPLTADVSFRMEVTGKGRSRTTSESVRVLRTRPSPIPEENQAPAPAAAKTPGPAAGKAPAADNPAQAVDDPSAEQQPGASGAPTKPFDASLLSSRLRPATATGVPVELPDAPAMSHVDVQAPSSIPGVNLNNVAPAPAAPPAAAQAPQAARAQAQRPAAGGQIRQAELVSRREPEYPKLARQMGVKGAVEVVATIGTDGKVKNVQVVHGHPLLVKAAVDAVMQWQYRPTLLNGVPVQNETRITLNFNGGQ
jgi:protein TonB